jgi:hypothetical protein
MLFCIPELADVGVDVYSVWCEHPAELVEGSAVGGKYQAVVVLRMLGMTGDDGDAAAYSSQIEEPAR